MRKIRLITESFVQRPALDTAVSRAILKRVSDGEEPETLRLYRPAAIVASVKSKALSVSPWPAVKFAIEPEAKR